MAAVAAPEENRRLPVARNATVVETVPTWRILTGAPLGVALISATLLCLAWMTPWTGRLLLAGVVMAAAAVLSGLGAVQTQRRAELVRQLQARLVPVTGPSLIKVRRWSMSREPRPRRLRIIHGDGAVVAHPGFTAAVCATVGEVADATYKVHSHRPRRNCLVLVLVPPAGDLDTVDDRSVQQRRAESLITTMLGPTSEVTSSQTDPATGSLVVVEGRHNIGVKVAAVGYQRRIENTFNKLMPGRWRASWDLVEDSYRFELRPAFPDLVRLPAIAPTDPDPLASYEAMYVPIGVDEDGGVVGWTPKVDPMFVIVGKTGQGKTVTARSMIMTVTAHNWAVWVVDGKGIEFLGLRDWPNVQIIANDVMEQVAVIHRAHELMEHRYKLVREGKARISDFEPVLLFIDEWADFRANLTDWWAANKVKGMPAKPPALGLLGSLLRKGRSSRLHVGLGTQRPDAEYFGGDMRDNLGMRISMGRLSVQGAQMMWDNPSTGVALPRGKRGRATAVNEQGHPVEVQTYYAPDPFTGPTGEDAQHLKELRPTGPAVQPRLLIVPPDFDAVDEEAAANVYHWYATAEWVRAEDRPDLDPLASGGDSTAVAYSGSPMAKLSLVPRAEPDDPDTADVHDPPQPAHDDAPLTEPATPEPPSSHDARRLRLVRADEHPDASEALRGNRADDDGLIPAFDEEDAHGSAEPTNATDLYPGCLLLEDAGTDHWVVVDDVTDDPVGEDLLVISWRDDDDLDGVMSVDPDAVLTARQPLEEDLRGAGDLEGEQEWRRS